MTPRNLVALLAVALLAFAVSARADDAQPAQPAPSATTEGTVQAPPSMKPPAELQKLATLLGKWNSEQHVFAVQDTPESRSKSTSEYRWSMNGMHLEGIHNFSFDGKPVEGRSFWSYDPDRKEYQCVWMDGMSPSTYVYTGTFTDDGKVAVKMSAMAKDKAINHVITFAFPTPDSYTMRYETDMTGAFQPMMEEMGTRAKVGVKEAMQKKSAAAKKKG